MENLNNLSPMLDHRPFFENDEHCEEWIDDTLSSLKNFPPQDIPDNTIQRMIMDLEYSKELLSKKTHPPQKEIDLQFDYITKDIIANEKDWQGLDSVYTKIWNYLIRKKAAENQ